MYRCNMVRAVGNPPKWIGLVDLDVLVSVIIFDGAVYALTPKSETSEEFFYVETSGAFVEKRAELGQKKKKKAQKRGRITATIGLEPIPTKETQ